MTSKLGIIGYPLGHTYSPIFQQAALDACRLDAHYDVWPTPPDKLAERIAALRSPDVLGCNVTVPHKEAVIPYLDGLDDTARSLMAVNTIVNRDGKLTGFNTDMPGFMESLRREGAFDPGGKSVVIVGAGGSARAVAVGLAMAGAASITLLNRTVERGASLAKELSARGVKSDARSLDAEPLARLPLDLLVNCTPYGMKGGSLEGQAPPVDSLLRPSTLVVDLVYNPVETPLLRKAAQAGARTLGGLPMLVYQGADAFRIWTGQEPPVDVMFNAIRKALGEK